MRRQSLGQILAVIALLWASPASGASFDFDTVPADGSLAAAPGDTVGWGYTITNTSDTLWLVLINLSADPVQQGLLDTGLFDFPVLAPLATVTQAFDAPNLLGLARFTWDLGAPDGFSNVGMFQLEGEFYSDDPFRGGQFVELADSATAAYAVTLQGGSAVVPEPSTLALLMVGLAAAKRVLTT